MFLIYLLPPLTMELQQQQLLPALPATMLLVVVVVAAVEEIINILAALGINHLAALVRKALVVIITTMPIIIITIMALVVVQEKTAAVTGLVAMALVETTPQLKEAWVHLVKCQCLLHRLQTMD